MTQPECRGTIMSAALPNHLENDRILGVEQVSTMFGISISTLRRLRRAGRFPPEVKLGERRIGWWAGDLVAAIEARRVAA
jgi:predicted DNA-binding transcriptional regulator AlpA